MREAVGMIINLLRAPEFLYFLALIVFVVWLFGIVYCDRVAFERGYNAWVARIMGIFLPIVAPLYYWNRKNKRRRHHHRHHHGYRSRDSWNTPYGIGRQPLSSQTRPQGPDDSEGQTETPDQQTSS
jgi:hypothetical protein